MSLILKEAQDLVCESWGVALGNMVSIGDYDVSMKDFCELVIYVFTNTELYADDPRTEYLCRLRDLVLTGDKITGGIRLVYKGKLPQQEVI